MALDTLHRPRRRLWELQRQPSYDLDKRSLWRKSVSFRPGSRTETEVVNPLELGQKRRFTPLVMFLIGRRGKGKTLFMTALAKIMYDRFQRNGESRRVLSNYSIKFTPEEWSDPYLLDRILENPLRYRNCLICVDEIASAFPGARAMTTINVNFVNFLTQIRKLRSELIFTTQFPQVVGRDILVQVDLFVRCETLRGGRAIKLYIYDWWGQWTGRDSMKAWPPQPGEHDWEMVIHGTHQMWGQYDTDEIIVPMRSDNRDQLVSEFYEVGDEPQDDEPVGELVQLDHGKPPGSLDDYMRNLGQEINLSQVKRALRDRFGLALGRDDLRSMVESHGYEIVGQGARTIARKVQE